MRAVRGGSRPVATDTPSTANVAVEPCGMMSSMMLVTNVHRLEYVQGSVDSTLFMADFVQYAVSCAQT
jgi:hypothetical protein